MSTRTRRRDWMVSIAPLLVLAAVTAVITLVFWPGRANLDTVGMYQYMVNSHYTDWHSALWMGIWRVMLLLGLGNPGWLLAGDVAMMLIGFYLLLRARFSRPWALLLATAVFVFPPVLAFAVLIGTDVWFGAALICGFGFAIRCVRTEGAARYASAALAVVFALLAMAARPTAAPPVFALFCALALGTVGTRIGGRRRWLTVAAAAAVATVLAFGAVLAVQRYVLHADQTHPEQGTYVDDLVALSLREHQMLLPADVYPRQDLQLLKRCAVTRNGEIDETPLLWGACASIPPVVEGKRLQSLQHAWLAAIRQHPADYLDTRLRSALWQLAISHDQVGAWYYPVPPSYGFGPVLMPGVQSRVGDYIALGTNRVDATGGPLQRVWIYVLVLLLATAYLGSRHRQKVILGLLSVGMVLYTAEMIFASPVVTYRYMWASVTVATALFPVLAADLLGWPLRRFGWRRSGTAREQDLFRLVGPARESES